MVDVTFPFILLFGGVLVDPWVMGKDILVGALAVAAGTALARSFKRA